MQLSAERVREKCPRLRPRASGRTHYNYYRDYEPSTGRYIESDPIGLAGGTNTYSYVGANPLRYSDSDGLFAPPAGVMNPATAAVTLSYVVGYGIGTVIYAAFDDKIQAMLPDPAPPVPRQATETDTPEKRAERIAYHKGCDEPPPTNLSKCDLIRWKIDRARRCIGKRKDYMSKWNDTYQGHYDQIANRESELANLEKRLAEECCGK